MRRASARAPPPPARASPRSRRAYCRHCRGKSGTSSARALRDDKRRQAASRRRSAYGRGENTDETPAEKRDTPDRRGTAAAVKRKQEGRGSVERGVIKVKSR